MTVEQSATNTENTGDNSANNNQAKAFSQEEVNAIVARTKTQIEKKFESKYSDL